MDEQKRGLKIKLDDERSIECYPDVASIEGIIGYEYVFRRGGLRTQIILTEEAIQAGYQLFEELKSRIGG